MIQLAKTVQAWGAPEFEEIFKQEIQALDMHLLPLQAGLSQSSYVSDEAIKVILIDTVDKQDKLSIKAGIFYSGIIAGSCCADDPTPDNHQTEYCDVIIELDKASANATINLLAD